MGKKIQGALIGLVAAFAIAGCDSAGKKCQSGEGVDPLMRWGACNESCAGKNNQESCAAAKIHAAAACAFTVKQGTPNGSACREACEAGDRASCAVK
jgi:hypothetical protein